MSESGEASPARVVADADVLAADLLVGGAARRAIDRVREHSWLHLVASDPLLDEAVALVADLADPALAADWREKVEELRTPVDHPAGDHPALASAYNGGAMHLLTLDRRLLGTRAGMYLRGRMDVSVRTPDAFDSVFDAASLYGAVETGEYPGPDRDPRA
jgi:predicted nucleic acid-binding protein